MVAVKKYSNIIQNLHGDHMQISTCFHWSYFLSSTWFWLMHFVFFLLLLLFLLLVSNWKMGNKRKQRKNSPCETKEEDKNEQEKSNNPCYATKKKINKKKRMKSRDNKHHRPSMATVKMHNDYIIHNTLVSRFYFS